MSLHLTNDRPWVHFVSPLNRPSNELFIYRSVDAPRGRFGVRCQDRLGGEQIERMPWGCPDCGAVALNGRTCQDLLRRFLGKASLTDPAAYGLAVACYALQHASRQSDITLDWAHYYVVEAAQRTRPLAEIRQRIRSRFDQDRDHPSIASFRSALADLPWQMNIGDLEVMQPDTDAECILIWAGRIVEDLHTRIQGTK
jgi:hypothetical protein